MAKHPEVPSRRRFLTAEWRYLLSEEFITEHYWGYARTKNGGCIEYRVEPPPWRVWSVTDPVLEGDMGALYGSAFAPALGGPPASAFLADGSAVTVYQGTRLKRPG